MDDLEFYVCWRLEPQKCSVDHLMTSVASSKIKLKEADKVGLVVLTYNPSCLEG